MYLASGHGLSLRDCFLGYLCSYAILLNNAFQIISQLYTVNLFFAEQIYF
ncbi:hypothetical protein LDG_8065 [Legionella drancourtii LLAP12]|uniref:Uncharacterized protein n=1 Tax=Legionella drancourtii LLAP12 TaxID=658187 RepID=G9ERZ3_9GAMM|nr:hypothetical protein LDG_8065 [Legionella drancourtii LLAP12]